jgi:hypothetical protein
VSDFIPWLRGLAEKGGRGVVNNIDARCLGRIADELERLTAQEKDYRDLTRSLIDMSGSAPVPEQTPTKEDFAEWSRVWHNTCETILMMLELPGSGSPQEMLAQVQAYVGSRPAVSTPGETAND